MAETTPNDPLAWAKSMAALEEADDEGDEYRALEDRLIPEDQADIVTSRSVRYAFYGDEIARTKALEDLGGEHEWQTLESKLGQLSVEGQFDLIAALDPQRKAAAFEYAARILFPQDK